MDLLKTVISLVVFAAFLVSAYYIFFSYSIMVVVPNGGEDWNQGSIHLIKWQYTGDPGPMVRIELLEGSMVNTVIDANISVGSGGVGLYRWTIPQGQSPGTNYKIRITSTRNGAYSHSSNAAFTISKSPPIMVVIPNGGENWNQGSTHLIKWQYDGDPGPMVRIELLRGANVSTVIDANTSVGSGGVGLYRWTIHQGQSPGTNYRIRIASTGNASYTDQSNENFEISG